MENDIEINGVKLSVQIEVSHIDGSIDMMSVYAIDSEEELTEILSSGMLDEIEDMVRGRMAQ